MVNLPPVESIFELGIIIASILVVVNIWITKSVMHGLSAKLIGLGLLFFTIDSVDKVLNHFNLDLIMLFATWLGEELFHDILKFSGMVLVVVGLFRLSNSVIYKKKN